jgi:hypothetical protein
LLNYITFFEHHDTCAGLAAVNCCVNYHHPQVDK